METSVCFPEMVISKTQQQRSTAPKRRPSDIRKLQIHFTTWMGKGASWWPSENEDGNRVPTHFQWGWFSRTIIFQTHHLGL
jgi:hypothetical protein